MKQFLVLAMLLCLTALPASPQLPPTGDEATHNELRAFRDGLIDAINRGDIERQLTYLHPNAVVTALNNEVSRGHSGVHAYFLKMMTGSRRVVESLHCTVNVDELTILYGGDTGIAFGSAVQSYKMTSGLQLDVNTRWTATLVRERGRWLLASLHVSANLFDNPLLAAAKHTAYWAGGISLALGLLGGFWLGRRRKGSLSRA